MAKSIILVYPQGDPIVTIQVATGTADGALNFNSRPLVNLNPPSIFPSGVPSIYYDASVLGGQLFIGRPGVYQQLPGPPDSALLMYTVARGLRLRSIEAVTGAMPDTQISMAFWGSMPNIAYRAGDSSFEIAQRTGTPLHDNGWAILKIPPTPAASDPSGRPRLVLDVPGRATLVTADNDHRSIIIMGIEYTTLPLSFSKRTVWWDQYVIQNLSFVGDPSPIKIKNRVYLFFQGGNRAIYYTSFTVRPDGTPDGFRDRKLAQPSVTKVDGSDNECIDTPVLTILNGRLYVFCCNTSGHLSYFHTAISGNFSWTRAHYDEIRLTISFWGTSNPGSTLAVTTVDQSFVEDD